MLKTLEILMSLLSFQSIIMPPLSCICHSCLHHSGRVAHGQYNHRHGIFSLLLTLTSIIKNENVASRDHKSCPSALTAATNHVVFIGIDHDEQVLTIT